MEGGGKRARRGPRVGGLPALEDDAQNNADLEQEHGQVIERDIILQQWEPSEFARLIDDGHGVVILPEDDPVDDSLAKITASFSQKSKDSVVQCKDGAWRPVEELDERTLRLLEESVARAVRLLVCLVRNGRRLNDCHTHIPVSLTYTPAEADVERLNLFLCTSYAGQAAGRRVAMAVEALAMHGEPLPPKIIVLQGGGGNSKSATTKLRANVFADSHEFMGASCLQKDDEFRKQGGQFAGAPLLTIQECSGGDPLQEKVAKKFASGEVLPCRPNYWETTEYFRWPSAGKFWELNFALPIVVGDPRDPPSLKSWWRRLLVVPVESSCSAPPAEVRVGDRVFLDDSTLSPFLGSRVARHIYMWYHLLPFLQKYSADDCRNFILLPDNDTQNLDDSINAFPCLFKRLPLAGGYQQLQIDLQKFSTAMSRMENCGGELGSFEERGEIWTDLERGRIRSEPDSNSDPDTTGAPKYNLAEPAAVLREAYIGSRQKQLESYIQLHEATGVQEGDFSTIEVKYYRPWGLPGRMYAFGMAAQKLTKQARAAAFQGHAVDVDFVAAFSRLGYREACRSASNSTAYGIWRKSIMHAGAWRGSVQDYMEISDDEAKKEITKLFFLGTPTNELPPLCALWREVDEGKRVIMDSPRFHYLHDQFDDRRTTGAARFAYAMFALGDEELAKLVEAIKGHDSST
ncbi:unnamed protein product [Prorocentrum cordatum]|uniref:Uncharacterized protein n=1 Tax=Prorocentrum cordatum TaxID=2364126 RepID=A0ABN9RVG6_9DINO|nr:unnamed protein product [Polarella glacialis]